MKISRRMRKGYALALAFLLTLPCLVRIQTEAATAIDTSVKCSLTVSVGSSDYEEDFNEMCRCTRWLMWIPQEDIHL